MNSPPTHKNRGQNKEGKVWGRDEIAVYGMLFEDHVGHVNKDLK